MEIIILKVGKKSWKKKQPSDSCWQEQNRMNKLQRHQSSVFIVGYSTVRNVNGFKLTGKVAHKCINKSRKSSKTSYMKYYIKNIIREKNPAHIVLQKRD